MRDALQANIQSLNAGFLRMHATLLEELALIRAALQSGELAGLGERVKRLDAEIDHLEVELEGELLNVFALQQPVAGDLRLMMLILKSLADLERAGDYAAHAARQVEQLGNASATLDLLPLLSQLSVMVEKVGAAFIERDAVRAREVIDMDDTVDAMYEQLQRTGLTRVLEDPRLIGATVQVSTLARSIERLGDHLVNVARRLERAFGTGR